MLYFYPVSEKEIENQILAWLNFQRGVFAFKNQTVGIYDPTRKVFRKTSKYVMPGASDIICLAYGMFIAIEVKTPITIKSFFKSPKTAKQRWFLTQINQNGGIGMVASCLSEVIQVIEAVKLNHERPKELDS